jgi:hypothetical protein
MSAGRVIVGSSVFALAGLALVVTAATEAAKGNKNERFCIDPPCLNKQILSEIEQNLKYRDTTSRDAVFALRTMWKQGLTATQREMVRRGAL